MRLLPPFALLLLLLSACGRYQASEDWPPEDFSGPTPNELSEEILRTLKHGQDATALVDQLAAYDPADLAAALDTRDKQLAFWVNAYNAMVQYLLTRNPELFEKREAFFGTRAFTVAGQLMSPNEMEHAIIRGGENRLGLGFVPQFFPNKFERTFKIKGGDSRVHFALNCGAADCPPVAIYAPETFKVQVETRIKKYLSEYTEIKEEGGKRVIYTSPLFSWFRGDFRDHGGINEFLATYGIIGEADQD
ncbi:MAG: DUF547 domain-containing protein, partial [Bacteroidota bacterium]